MKNSRLILAFCLAISSLHLFSQEYKVQKSSGRLELHIGNVTVEGTTGSEIITSRDGHDNKDERAAGLVAINGSGLQDNTGLGINVNNSGSAVVVNQLQKTKSPGIKILVPKGVIISYEYESQYGHEAKFKNLENELEISATYNSIELENITGPATVKTIYSSKADLNMKTSYGEMYVAPEFKIELDRTTDKDSDMVNMSANKVLGKINGGGLKLDLRSDYSKIYLRKK